MPAADEYIHWQDSPPSDAPCFRRFVERTGLARELSDPTSRWHGVEGKDGPSIGIYCFAPSGVPLGEVNQSPRTGDPAAIRRMLVAALARYAKLPRGDRLMELPSLPQRPSWRWQDVVPREAVPAGTIALRCTTRDLPRDPVDQRRYAPGSWNSGFVWLDRPERLVPESAAVGAERAVERSLVERLARFHLVDNVLGRTLPYAPEHVETAELTSRVTAVEGDVVALYLTGRTRAVARGRWRLCESQTEGVEAERGVETELRGWARWDRSRGAFVRFELIALGTRWGSTSGNRRYVAEYPPITDDRGPAPLGVAFTLYERPLADSVPPYFLYHQGPAAYFGRE